MFAVNKNDSLECPKEFLSNIIPIVRNLQLVFLLLLVVAALTLNLLILTVAWKNRHSKSDSKVMDNVAAIAALDIVWVLLVPSIAFFVIVLKYWPSGEIFCNITGSLTLGVVLLRNQLVGLALLDRFCSVFAPFSYPMYRRKVTGTLVVAAVAFSIVYAILPAVVRTAGRYTFYSVYATCFMAVSCADSACYGYITVMATHWIVCWVILPTVLFSMMCIKARIMMQRSLPAMGTFTADVTMQTAMPPLAQPGNEAGGLADSTISSSASLASTQTKSTLTNTNNSIDSYTSKPNIANTIMLNVAVYVGCFLPLAVHFASYRMDFNTAATKQTELDATIGFICGDINLLLTVLDPAMALKNRRMRSICGGR